MYLMVWWWFYLLVVLSFQKAMLSFPLLLWWFYVLKPIFLDNGQPLLLGLAVCSDMWWCWRKGAIWGGMFDIWSIYLNCTVISILYLKNCEVYFKCICRQYCQTLCLSTAPAVFIYRQLYLVVMLFFGIKTACLSGIETDWWHTLALSWSPCPFSAFHSLFYLPSWLDAISSGSVNPHLGPLRGPTESLLANISLFLSTHSTINKVTWYRPNSQQSQSQHNIFSLTHTHKHLKIHTLSLRCSYIGIQTQLHTHRHAGTQSFGHIATQWYFSFLKTVKWGKED